MSAWSLAPWLQQPHLAVLVLLLLAAAVIDWRFLRIPNALTLGGAALGLLLSLVAPASADMGPAFALSGLALGLVLMLPLYLLGVMGAGDVKLMAMAGTYLGVPDTLHAVLYVFVTGGVLALVTVALRRAWAPLWVNLRQLGGSLGLPQRWRARREGVPAPLPSLGKLPYGLSICLGTLVYLASSRPGLL